MAVTVICGVNSLERSGLIGKTVAEVRSLVKQALNVDPRAGTAVNGQTVDATYVLQDGDQLEFVHPGDTKGYALEKAGRFFAMGFADLRNSPSGEGVVSKRSVRVHNHQASFLVLYEVAEEGGYVALVPALPGCHSQGDTLEEAADNIREAIEVYLESLTAHGDPIPDDKHIFQGVVTVPLPRT
jgi:antitoxin HicB